MTYITRVLTGWTACCIRLCKHGSDSLIGSTPLHPYWHYSTIITDNNRVPLLWKDRLHVLNNWWRCNPYFEQQDLDRVWLGCVPLGWSGSESIMKLASGKSDLWTLIYSTSSDSYPDPLCLTLKWPWEVWDRDKITIQNILCFPYNMLSNGQIHWCKLTTWRTVCLRCNPLVARIFLCPPSCCL